MPFFPQDGYNCGPNALATALSRTGLARTPDSLVGDVYLPGRKGSLQIEMVSATRRLGRLGVELEPQLDAIVAELHAGRPVVVLQNLGVRWLPVWHYAVVFGYDASQGTLVLRSGDTPRRVMTLHAFDRTWARSGRWAIVLLNVDELPASDNLHAADAYVQSIVGLESAGQIEGAHTAYCAGLQRWPQHKILLFGSANTAYRLGNRAEAVEGYRALLAIYPGFEAARKNLDHVLAEIEAGPTPP